MEIDGMESKTVFWTPSDILTFKVEIFNSCSDSAGTRFSTDCSGIKVQSIHSISWRNSSTFHHFVGANQWLLDTFPLHWSYRDFPMRWVPWKHWHREPVPTIDYKTLTWNGIVFSLVLRSGNRYNGACFGIGLVLMCKILRLKLFQCAVMNPFTQWRLARWYESFHGGKTIVERSLRLKLHDV